MTTTDHRRSTEHEKRAPDPRPVVHELPEYTTAPVADVPVRFRASSNESALPPSPRVVAAAAGAVSNGNRYPSIGAADLMDAIAAHTGLASEQIAVADGALSLLTNVLLTYVRPGDRVVYGWRSYEAYPICVQTAHGEPVAVPLTPDHEIDLPAMARAAADARVVVLCNPNNPTGTAFGRERLVDFLAEVPDDVVVVYDEAYVDFMDASLIDPFDAAELIAAHPNLVVMRTFSKVHSMAGLRVGYLLADAQVAGAVRRVCPPFPVAAPAVAAAIAALDDHDHAAQNVAAVARERRAVAEALADAGLVTGESHTNFLWAPCDDAAERAAELRAAGVATRPFPEGLRVSVGEAGLAEAVREALGGP